MISQSDINEYRQIKAPDKLKEKVFSMQKQRRSIVLLNMKTISSIAACLIIGVFGFLLFNNKPLDVTLTPMTPQTTSSISTRTVDVVTIMVECKGSFDVSAEDDSFSYYVSDSAMFKPLKSLKNVNNVLEIAWTVSDSPSYLKINGEMYKISYSLQDNQVVIVKEKN